MDKRHWAHVSFLTKALPSILLAPLIFGSLSCANQDHSSIQRSPSGPCWNVDIKDGFSTGDELIDTFSCLNQNHTFSSFLPSIEALQQEDRRGTPIKDDVAAFVTSLMTQGNFAIFPLLTDIIVTHPNSAQIISDSLELLLYGHTEIEDAQDPKIESDGILTPLLPLTLDISTQLLDHPTQRQALVRTMEEEELSDLFCTITALEEQPHTQALLHQLPYLIGTALEATQNADNDRWLQASGDSFRDVIQHLIMGENPPLLELASEVNIIASDTRIQSPLKNLAIEHLHPDLLDSLEYLIAVDAQGGSLSNTEESALHKILEVMHQTNAPVECEFEILSIPITQISIDNLAVELLFRISNQDAQSINAAIDLLNILDLGLTEWMLDIIVEREVCPILTSELVENLNSLQRLGDAPVEPLLNMGIDVLKILRHPTDSRIPEFANILASIHNTQLTSPTEELLRDIVQHDILRHFLEIAPTLPELEAACDQPIEFHDFMRLIASIFAPDNIAELTPLLSSIISTEELWEGANRSTLILQKETFSKIIPILFDIQPHVSISLTAEDVQLLLYVLEDQSLHEALFSLSQDDAPLFWMGEFIIEDTLEEAHALLTWLNNSLNILGAQ